MHTKCTTSAHQWQPDFDSCHARESLNPGLGIVDNPCNNQHAQTIKLNQNWKNSHTSERVLCTTHAQLSSTTKLWNCGGSTNKDQRHGGSTHKIENLSSWPKIEASDDEGHAIFRFRLYISYIQIGSKWFLTNGFHNKNPFRLLDGVTQFKMKIRNKNVTACHWIYVFPNGGIDTVS